MPIRTLFLGTPDFAVASLDAVAALSDLDLVHVISQPDRPAGRGKQLRPSPVKARAEALGLPVWTPEKLRGPEALERLRALDPELLVVVAYGEILRPAVLAMPRLGAINVHASLLPRHRGASPIAAALLAGDAETGVTIMQMDEGMDTGPMLTTGAIPIRPEHTLATLSDDLATLGATLLAETLPRYLVGEIVPQPQDHEAATYTRLIRKEDGRLDWTRPATDLANQVRAYDPWPGTFTEWNGQLLKVIAVQAEAEVSEARPGTVQREGNVIRVATGEGWLRLDTVQPPGKRPMAARDFANGAAGFVGSVVG